MIIEAKNDSISEEVKGRMKERKLLLINIMENERGTLKS